jgi:hypothetical protein
VRAWVDTVATEAGADDLGAVFSGWHAGTLPSLVLCCEAEAAAALAEGGTETAAALASAKTAGDEAAGGATAPPAPPAAGRQPSKAKLMAIRSAALAVQEAGEAEVAEGAAAASLEVICGRLLQLAKPAAVHHSPTLRAARGGGSYGAEHADLPALLSQQVLAEATPALVLTQSPLEHLLAVVVGIDGTGGPLDGWTLMPTQLARWGTEAQFAAEIANFLAGGGGASAPAGGETRRVLLLQCDPATSAPGLLHHAMHLCQLASARAPAAATAANRIVLLIHLPAGTARRRRAFSLDFRRGWGCFFIDDLRAVASGSGVPGVGMQLLLGHGIGELAGSGRLPLGRIIAEESRAALLRCTAPWLSDSVPAEVAAAHSFARRVEMLRRLAAVPRFESLLQKGVGMVLQRADADTHGRQVQTRAAAGGTFGGTFREALHHASRLLVTQATAHVLRALDENFNLGLLLDAVERADDPLLELWFALASAPSIIDWTVLAARARLGGAADDVAADPVNNSGRHGPLIARFPFSARLVRLLEHPETREVHAGADVPRVTAAFEAAIGEQAAAACRGRRLCDAYCHDMVASVSPHFAALPFAPLLAVYRAYIGASHAHALASPGAMHAAAWACAASVYHAAALLAAAELPPDATNALLARCDAAARAPGASVASLDRHLLLEVLRAAWADARALARVGGEGVSWRELGARVARLTIHAEALLAFAAPAASGEVGASASASSPAEDEPAASWRGLRPLVLFGREAPPAAGVAPAALDELAAAACAPLSGIAALRTLLAAAARATDVPGAFARCYMQEVLLPAAIAGDPERAPLDAESCEHLVSCLADVPAPAAGGKGKAAGKAPTGKAAASGIVPLSPACRSLLLHALSRAAAEVPPLGAALEKLPALAGTRGCAAYLEQHEALGWTRVLSSEGAPAAATLAEHLAADMAAAGAELSNEERLRAVRFGGELAPSKLRQLALADLQAVAGAKVRLALFVRRLAESLRGPAGRSSTEAVALITGCAQTRELLCHRLEPIDLRLFVLRLLWREGGLGMLSRLLTLPVSALSWLPMDVGASSKVLQTSQLLDPFRWLFSDGYTQGAMYASIVTLVRNVATFREAPETRDAALSRLRKELDQLDGAAILALVGAHFSLTSPVLHDAATLRMQRVTNAGETGGLLPAVVMKLRGETARAACTWVLGGCEGGVGSGRWREWQQGRKQSQSAPPSKRTMVQLQLSVHLLLRCVAPGSWWHSVLVSPSRLTNSFVPTMHSAPEMLLVMRGMNEYVAWYRCPRGHPYSVGACTRPMEVSSCPQCGAQIGGSNHTDVRGVTRLGTLEDMGLAGRDPNTRDGLKSAGAKGDDGSARRGYYRDDFSIHDLSFGGVAGPRIGPVACRVMRIFINLVLWAAGAIDPARWAEVALLLRLGHGVGGAQVSVKAEEQAQDFLMQQVRRDWSALCDTFRIDDEELALALHLVVRTMPKVPSDAGFATEAARSEFEFAFQADCVAPVFGSKVGPILRAAQAELEPKDRTQALRRALGADIWDQLTATSAKVELDGGVVSWLWMPAPDCSHALFVREFQLAANNSRRFPTLAALLRHEARLPLIRHIADVLRWHAVLFEALGGTGLRRDEATALTNAELVDRLPEDAQPAAREALTAFCDGFNAAFPLVERLYECQVTTTPPSNPSHPKLHPKLHPTPGQPVRLHGGGRYAARRPVGHGRRPTGADGAGGGRRILAALGHRGRAGRQRAVHRAAAQHAGRRAQRAARADARVGRAGGGRRAHAAVVPDAVRGGAAHAHLVRPVAQPRAAARGLPPPRRRRRRRRRRRHRR